MAAFETCRCFLTAQAAAFPVSPAGTHELPQTIITNRHKTSTGQELSFSPQTRSTYKCHRRRAVLRVKPIHALRTSP
jgi:hypothetical protein